MGKCLSLLHKLLELDERPEFDAFGPERILGDLIHRVPVPDEEELFWLLYEEPVCKRAHTLAFLVFLSVMDREGLDDIQPFPAVVLMIKQVVVIDGIIVGFNVIVPPTRADRESGSDMPVGTSLTVTVHSANISLS